MVSISSKNLKIISILFTILSLILIGFIIFSFWPSTSKNTNGKQADQVNLTSTTTENTSTTTTIQALDTSTTIKTKVKAESTTTSSSTSPTTTTPTTPTTPPLFVATSTSTNSNVSITQCISAQYTFTGTIHTNIPGSVDWTWIRDDGVSTGVSGNITVTNSDITTDAITPYVFTKYNVGDSDTTGWVALKLTWSGGTFISPHSEYTFTHAQVNQGYNIIQGC